MLLLHPIFEPPKNHHHPVPLQVVFLVERGLVRREKRRKLHAVSTGMGGFGNGKRCKLEDLDWI